MHYTRLEPATAALLDVATGDRLLPVLADLLDLDLDAHVVVERRAPGWVVLVLGLHGDTIILEHEVPVLWHAVAERVRLGVMAAYLDGVLLGADRWRRSFDRQLALLRTRTLTLADS
jgi:hypothetical protein